MYHNKGKKSVVLSVSISNEPGLNGKPSLYNRLHNYCRSKGIKEQEAVRFAIAMLLDKTGN